MKSLVLFLIFSLLFFNTSFSQQPSQGQLVFKNNVLAVPQNVTGFDWNNFAESHRPVDGKRIALAVFNTLPNVNERRQLAVAGIELVQFIPPSAYTIAISKPVSQSLLQSSAIYSLAEIPVAVKLDQRLQDNNFPSYAIKKPGTIDVLVQFNSAVPMSYVVTELKNLSFEITDGGFATHHLLTIRIPRSNLESLAQMPYVSFIQPIAPADKPLNDEVRSNSRANVLQAPISKGGENLQGEGVVIGIGDDADITSHVDLADRVIERSAFLYQNHGTQMAGVAAGNGNKEVLYKGVAPKATIISQLFSGIIRNAPAYVTDYGMVVTNNSYGSITGECEYGGVYDLYSKILDEQAFTLPKLLHVFAAGNDGTITCPGYTTGFHTALGGYQSAKNILSVGWGEKYAIASENGSHGPTADGRIKPDITATGSEVRSTGANNTYITDYGSSLSSPVVAGGAALLVEKYRQLNSGADPDGALVKALLMNGANDIGNPGPDFKSGFGWLNLNRSLAIIKENRIIAGTLQTGTTATHTMTVPAGTSQVKVMLYWHDPAAAVFASSSLVNDLDLELVTPANGTLLPWVLDTSRANVNTNATRGVDRINNVEQITLDNPAAGTYTIRVKGTAINQNSPQQYYVVYDFLPAAIDLTFPSVGEPLVAGETVTINWDVWDASGNMFTLQYSLDNGGNWTNISTSIPANDKQYLWLVPDVVTSQAKVRLLRNGTSLSDESVAFVIARQPVISPAAVQCPGYFAAQWTPITGAPAYEVMMKKGSAMEVIATTNNIQYTAAGLSTDSLYWMTVRPLINGQPGRRAVAISLQPNSGSCAGAISDNDLKLDSIISPVTGRKQTSFEITTNNLSFRIKNLDDAPVNSFKLKYSVNGAPLITEQVNTPIPAQGTYIHVFTGLNFSAAGDYNILAVVKNATTDPVAQNDTLQTTIRQLPNPAITLPFVENFESAPVFEVTGSTTGLPGLNRWDLRTSTPFGRARSFVNTGIALNGNRAITLDVLKFVVSGNTNHLIGTFNLENYAPMTPDNLGLTLDFWYKHHGQQPSVNNRVWVRSSDTSPWVQVYNLDSAQALPGVWKKVGPIHLSNIAGTSQLTSSYQVRIGQAGMFSMGDDVSNAGITIDSLRLFSNPFDVAIARVDTPLIKSCGLDNNVPLKVFTVQYRANPVSVPIKYKVDNGPVVTETLPAGGGTYTFTQRLNLSTPGQHTIIVWVDGSQDNDHSNDTATIVVQNQPVINTFPYIQNFENGQGSWYAEGHNSSWQFGTPSSIKINKAASGTHAWKTSLQGTYNDDEQSYLYSPCFNISTLSQPWLSMSLAMDFEQCGQDICDRAWIEYSTNGSNWIKLGKTGQGFNWYNRTDDNVWDSAGFKRWHSAGIALPTGLTNLQLRVVLKSDGSLIKEGIAIDDIHIYDRQFGIYTGPSVTTPVVQNVATNTWNNFTKDGDIIAAVKPGVNNLGNTGVQVFIHQGGFSAVRNINGQYFLDRNITVKPATINNNDSSAIRFYFTDTEVDTIVRATGCSGCSKPQDAYELGVTKYDAADDSKENGDLLDNTGGVYSFIPKSKVSIVPYDAGYYAEFKVKDFSEFWLNNGGINGNLPLPLLITDFRAARQNKDVLLQWSVANEISIEQFEVQVARGNDAYRTQQFTTLQSIPARNTTQGSYQLTDVELNKSGTRYYRLKITDKNGQVWYSDVKVIVFNAVNTWTVYPNPASQVLNVITQAETGKKIEIRLMNVTGQVLWQKTIEASGFTDKLQIDLVRQKIPAGFYVVKINSNDEVRQFKVVKQ